MASEIVDEDSSQSSEDRLMPAGNRLFTSFDYYDYGQTGLGNQGLQNQDFANQGLANQGLGNQGLQNQGFSNQGQTGLGNQGLANQGLAYQGLANQGLGNQGRNQGLAYQVLGNQGLGNQGLANQGLGNQGLGNQGLLNQGLGYQSLQGLLGNTRLVNQNQLQNQNRLAQNGLHNQQQKPVVQNRLNYVDYGNYDYGGPLIYNTVGAYGGASCREDQVNIGVLTATVAGIGLMFYTLLTKIQANGGRYLMPPSLFSIDAFDRIYESK
jgi:hypothetical protein